MRSRVLVAAAVALLAAGFSVPDSAAAPPLDTDPGVADPDTVFVFPDPPAAPPVHFEATPIDEPVDVDVLLGRIEELEQREQTNAALLKSLDSQFKKQKAQEQAKKAADAKKPTIKWSAQMEADSYWFNQDAASRATYGDIENGEAFRHARFGLFGDYGPTEYRVEMDFALSNRPSFLDVFGGVHDIPVIGRVRVGHFFEPFSLERLTANRFTTFMERALTDQAFAPARNMGTMANNTFLDERGTWGLGFFRSDSDGFGDDVGDKFESAVTGRLTFLPLYDNDGTHYVHLGAGYSWRAPNNERARFRAQPEARIGSALPNVPFFVDTGNIPADSYQLVGLEAAWICGPFSLQAEYMGAPVDAKTAGHLYFDGWYAQATYFLTGEHRPYRRDAGTFDRVDPETDAVRYTSDKQFECGPGAWEVAVRVSQLDLNSAAVLGGEITDFTVGLNWYLNPYLRVTSNYIRAMADDPVGGPSDTDIFAVRVGFEF